MLKENFFQIFDEDYVEEEDFIELFDNVANEKLLNYDVNLEHIVDC